MCHTEILRVVGDQGLPSVPSLNVANVQPVPVGSQAVGEGALPGGQLAHLGHQRHEVHIPTGTPLSAATQNSVCQLDHIAQKGLIRALAKSAVCLVKLSANGAKVHGKVMAKEF